MNRLTLGLASAWLLACAGAALAQGGPNGAMMPSYQTPPGYGYGGQMGYPAAAPAGYPMMQPYNAQQAMYGDASASDGGGPPMDGGAAGPYDGSCPQCGEGGGCCPPFVAAGYAYGDFELFYARRTNGYSNQPLVVDSLSGATDVSTKALEFDYEPGLKATAGYMWSQGFGVEGTYFGQFYMHTGLLVSSSANELSLPGAIGMNTDDFGAVPQISAFYTSQIQNGELNFVLPYGSFQWLGGFRYMQVQESLDINGLSGDGTSSDYVIHTNNNLYCGQIGARGQWEIGMFQFEAAVKAGLGENFTNEQQTIRDVNNTFMVTDGAGDTRNDINATKNTVAFIGEVDLTAMVPMGSHWTARLGYTGVWVTDLALAPNQLDFGIPATTGNSVNRSGNILLHGFTAGAECRF